MRAQKIGVGAAYREMKSPLIPGLNQPTTRNDKSIAFKCLVSAPIDTR